MRTDRRTELLAVSAGGAVGALVRYAAFAVWPTRSGGFPWATFAVNVTGCLLIGLSMALVTPRLWRVFLGPGLLGGFTTFSTYAEEVRALLDWARPGTAVAYLAATVLAALAAVAAGGWLARRARR
ncbi:fluoride efflux transporter CrcB [Actinophytocola xanthii]|uniref:fluoride efflux transporter CrcB n=1 Tax=Actinophytocola xanthii TaxID=1912961 RepID=UPI001E638C8F|nr:fluoride efflux transporter CrcB [Actinophytocola xanthii]